MTKENYLINRYNTQVNENDLINLSCPKCNSNTLISHGNKYECKKCGYRFDKKFVITKIKTAEDIKEEKEASHIKEKAKEIKIKEQNKIRNKTRLKKEDNIFDEKILLLRNECIIKGLINSKEDFKEIPIIENHIISNDEKLLNVKLFLVKIGLSLKDVIDHYNTYKHDLNNKFPQMYHYFDIPNNKKEIEVNVYSSMLSFSISENMLKNQSIDKTYIIGRFDSNTHFDSNTYE